MDLSNLNHINVFNSKGEYLPCTSEGVNEYLIGTKESRTENNGHEMKLNEADKICETGTENIDSKQSDSDKMSKLNHTEDGIKGLKIKTSYLRQNKEVQNKMAESKSTISQDGKIAITSKRKGTAAYKRGNSFKPPYKKKDVENAALTVKNLENSTCENTTDSDASSATLINSNKCNSHLTKTKKASLKTEKNVVNSNTKTSSYMTTTKNNASSIVTENRLPSPNIFQITDPLIGTSIITDTNVTSANFRYDWAILRNRYRYRVIQKEGLQIPEENFQKGEKKQKKEYVENDPGKKRQAIRMAHCIIKITIKILQLLLNDSVKEKQLAKLFVKFLHTPVTPSSLIYSPQFIHAVKFCRGHKGFSRDLRKLADICYQKCHCMFPVPLGSNFETVYVSKMKEFIPDSFDNADYIKFDYEELSETSDSESEKPRKNVNQNAKTKRKRNRNVKTMSM